MSTSPPGDIPDASEFLPMPAASPAETQEWVEAPDGSRFLVVVRGDGPGAPSSQDSLSPQMSRRSADDFRREQRFRLLLSTALFLATFASTFLVGSDYMPLRLLPAYYWTTDIPLLNQLMVQSILRGLEYSVPLMLILFCHEMGHYLQSVRYRIAASFPFFIPLPLPPLGTMGAVILQGRSVANRRQMFDIAVSGPLAGLIVTMPFLYYGISTSEYGTLIETPGALKLGEPLIVKWMIHWLHGPQLPGQEFMLNGIGFAAWVGVFITAMNLLPVGQLDGGHILYTLVGRKAHLIAMITLIAGTAMMIYTGVYAFVLLMILLMLTGIRHPPTANDKMPLGFGRQAIGWLTMCFLGLGFTPEPMMIVGPTFPDQPERNQRVDPADVNPNDVVKAPSKPNLHQPT